MSMDGRLFTKQEQLDPFEDYTFLSTAPITPCSCSGRGGTFGVPLPPMTGVDGSSLGQVASVAASSWVQQL